MNTSPEFQARLDWRDEGAFRPGQYIGGDERTRYIAEASEILQQNAEASV